MEIYKPSALALQNTFTICGMQLKFSEGFDEFNAVRAAFNRRAYMAQVEMTEYYEKQIHSMEQLLSTGVAIMERINRESAEFAVSVLMYYGIETVTPEKLTTLATAYTEKTRDGNRYSYTIYWENIFKDLIKDNLKPIQERVKAVSDFQNELSFQRQVQRANRSRWYGGGFGLSGAIKGAMMAGMMNAGTSIFRGIGDSFINANDAARVRRLKDSVIDGAMPLANFNFIIKSYVMNLYEVTKGYLSNTMGYYQPDVPGKIKYTLSKKDIENAVGKFSNYELFYKNGAKTAAEVRQAIIEYMLINIWDINALRSLYLLSERGVEKKSLIELTPYLGMQYEFASIALNIDQDILEEAEEQRYPEAELSRIRKETEERAKLIDFLISSDDTQIESAFLKKIYINKNNVYVEKSASNPAQSDFSQEDFKLLSNASSPSFPFVLSFLGSPFNGKIRIQGFDFIYDGDFKDGNIHGQGRIEYSNGNVFDGELANGAWVKGKLTTANFVYDGEFIYNKEKNANFRHGKGRLVYSDGQVIDGTFANGKSNGYTKIVNPNGDTIEGTFQDDKLHGEATINTKNYILDGKFVNGSLVFASIRYSNGETYTGDILNEEGFGKYWAKSGSGTYTYANGQTYTGNWKDSKRHGHGSLTDKNGVVIYSGEWVNDTKKGGGLLSKLIGKF